MCRRFVVHGRSSECQRGVKEIKIRQEDATAPIGSNTPAILFGLTTE